MKKLTVIIAVVLILSIEAFAQPAAVSCQAKGQGTDRDQAIKSALEKAVIQVRGAIVSSRDQQFNYSSDTSDIGYKPDLSGKKISFDSVSIETSGTVSQTEIAGLVKSYKVISEKLIDPNVYEVTLKAWVYDYRNPDANKRMKVAVMRPRVLKKGYRFGSFIMSSDQMSAKMVQKLTSALTDTNKFSVLDRENTAEFIQNRNILLSGDSSLEQKAKLGQVLGADYMLVGTIDDVRLQIKTTNSSIIGTPISEYNADFVFDYKLIAGPTRQVIAADNVTIRMDDTSEVKKLVSEWEPENLDYKELADNFIAMAAKAAVEQIVDELYPVRVAKIDETGRVIIAQGGKRIKAGQLLEVFALEEEVFDPDTEESLGKIETLIATIKVDKVDEKIAYASLVKGEAKKLSKGMICRKKSTSAKSAPVPQRQSQTQLTPSGGVRLPFDKE